MGASLPRFRINREQHKEPHNGFMRNAYVVQELCTKKKVYKDYKYHYGFSKPPTIKIIGLSIPFYKAKKVYERVELPNEDLAHEVIERLLVEEKPDKPIKYKKPKKKKEEECNAVDSCADAPTPTKRRGRSKKKK